MKPWLKIALAAFLGFGGGFGVGFWFHKKLNDVEFEEVSEEEMNKIEGQLQEKEASTEKEYGSDDQLPTDKDELRFHLQGKKSYIQADREAKEAYSKIWETVKDYSSEENANELPTENMEEGFDEGFIQEALEEDKEDTNQPKPPYPISLIDFYNERNEYDKITIDWYEPKVFVDEREEIIADITSYVGSIDLDDLFNRTGDDEDPDIRFVRNEGYSTDYEIIRHHKTWPEMVGMGGSE